MKRIVSLLLVLLMLSAMLFSCQKNEDELTDADGNSVVKPEGEINLEVKDDEGYVKDRIPDGEELKALGFEGSTVKILSWENEEGQTFPKEDSSSDPIKSKLYNHWIAIEERLSISFDTKYTDSEWTAKETFLTAARSDDVQYDLIQTQSLFPITLAQEGRLCNLMKLGFPDLEMPWWPESTKQWSQHGALFFIASNSSAMGISNMNVVFVNDGMITSKGVASPVESVLRGVWNIEEMTEITKLFAGSVAAAEEKDRIYGLVVDDPSRVDSFYYSRDSAPL